MGPAMQTGARRRGMPLYGSQDPQQQQYDPNSQPPQPQYGPPANYQSPFNPGLYGSPAPSYTGNDIAQQWQNNRNSVIAQGQQLQGQNNQFGSNQDWMRQYYQSQADPVAQQMLAGNGGYTPQEQQQIMQSQQYQSGMTTPQGYAALNPTASETAGMTGNVGSYSNYFDPANMDAVDRSSADFQRAQLNQAGGAQNEAIAGQANANNVYNQDLKGAIDPSKLSYDPSGVNSALGAGDTRIAGSYDPNNLTQSQDFVNRYRMTNGQVNDMTTAAGTTEGNLTRARQDQVAQAAAASGTNSPMALAAAMNRMQTTSDAQAGDAMLNARIAARNQQAQREQTIESGRLGAQQGLASMNEGQNLAIAGRDLNTAQSNAGNTLAAQQGLAGMNVDAATRANAATNNLTGQRLNAAQYQGQLGTGVEAGIGNRAQNTQQFITNTGTGIAQAQDQTAAQRAAQLYGTRQGNLQYQQQNTYNQNTGLTDRASANATKVGDMRINQQNAGLGYMAGQQGMANQNVNNSLNRGTQLYGTQGQLQNQATSGNSNWEIGNQGNTALQKTFQGIKLATGVGNMYNGRQ